MSIGTGIFLAVLMCWPLGIAAYGWWNFCTDEGYRGWLARREARLLRQDRRRLEANMPKARLL